MVTNPIGQTRFGSKWLVWGMLFSGVVLVVPFVASKGSLFSSPSEVSMVLSLPYYTLRTLIRMTLTYILSLGLGLFFGIMTATNKRLSLFLIPIFDVLQSVPVLGFFPAAVVFFISAFQGSELGLELASMLLIFTGMEWSILFGVIGAVKTIPSDVAEAARVSGLGGFKYVQHIVLPAIFPSLIANSVLAWGSGWYFLVACEYIVYGGRVYTLPGLGSFISRAAYEYGSLSLVLIGLATMTMIILLINRLVWHRLMGRVERYQYGIPIRQPTAKPGREAPITGKLGRVFSSMLLSAGRMVTARVTRITEALRARWSRRAYIFAVMTMVVVLTFFVTVFLIPRYGTVALPSPQRFLRIFTAYPEVGNLPVYLLRSLLRLFLAYSIALGWTILAGVLIARSRTLENVMVPVFDIVQSIPALALFPVVVVFCIRYFHGSELGLELASIFLLLTGMQWYLLFNIIGAVHSIPRDVVEAAEVSGLRGWNYVKHVLLPAIFPAVVTGSVLAWGGGWNSVVVSEYIPYGGKTYTLPGLGYFLSKAAYEYGDTLLIVFNLLVMCLIIIVMNRLIWYRLMKKVEKYAVG